MCVLLLLLLHRFSRVRLCVTPWTAAHQAPLSTGFSRQEHWSGLPVPSPLCCLELSRECMFLGFLSIWSDGHESPRRVTARVLDKPCYSS